MSVSVASLARLVGLSVLAVNNGDKMRRRLAKFLRNRVHGELCSGLDPASS